MIHLSPPSLLGLITAMLWIPDPQTQLNYLRMYLKIKNKTIYIFLYIGVAFGVNRFKISKMKILQSVVYLFMGRFWIYVSQNVCLDMNDFLVFPNLYFGLNWTKFGQKPKEDFMLYILTYFLRLYLNYSKKLFYLDY